MCAWLWSHSGQRTRVIYGFKVKHSETISVLFRGLLAEGDVNKTIQERKWAFSSKCVVINNLWGFWACVSWQQSYDHTCKPSEGKNVCPVLFNRIPHPIHMWFIIIYWFGFWHSVFLTDYLQFLGPLYTRVERFLHVTPSKVKHINNGKRNNNNWSANRETLTASYDHERDMWNCNLNADHEELLIPAPRFHSSLLCSESQSSTIKTSRQKLHVS